MNEIKGLKNKKDGKIYDSFPDLSARERLTDIEYQPITTDLAYSHKDLPEGEKTVTVQGDGTFGETALVGNFENLIPNGGFSRTFPFRGITVAKKGDGYVVSGTSTETAPSFYFTDSEGNYEIPISSDLIGKTLIHAVFANNTNGNVALSVTFLNESKTQISKVSAAIKTAIKEITVPDGTAYIRVQYYSQPNQEYNSEFKYYLLEKDKCQTVTLNEGVAEIQGVTDTMILSVPYKNTASYIVSLRKLIDDYAGGGNVTYLTPEDFGAFGDGATDDSTAIAECLNVASQTGKIVIMAGRYFITSPMTITQSGLEIICNDIVYAGTDCAVKIIGRENKIKIHSIISNGVGIGFYANGTRSTSYNSIEVNTVTTQSHGIVFCCGASFAHQNTIKFELIRAGGSGCYGIAFPDGEAEEGSSSFIAECNLYGGQIANCEWAVYKVGGNSRCYGFEIEEDVQGGFYTCESGGLTVFYPRSAEAARDGNLPFYKFTGTNNVHIHGSAELMMHDLDLTDAIDVFETSTGEYPLNEKYISVYNGKLTTATHAEGEATNIPSVYTYKAYIWGKFLIMTPYMAYRKVVDTATFDTRVLTPETYSDITKFSQLPTKFVVDNINTEIYLHESYCAFGFNEFEVEQANGFTCKIYDKLDNLIFDGTEQGNGLYKFNVYKDADKCATGSAGLLRRDFLGHYWSVTKIADATEIWTAIDSISGGIDEIETLIDDSEVLDE